MPKFPSNEWLNAWADILNNNPTYVKEGKDFAGDFLLVIAPDEEYKQFAYMYADCSHGQVKDHRILPAMPEKKTTFTFTATMKGWHKLVEGKTHFLVMLARKDLKLEGNLAVIMRFSRVGEEVSRAFASVPTEF